MTEKVMITSACPKCKNDFTREEYVGIPVGVLALTMCPACDDGIVTITQTYSNIPFKSQNGPVN